MCVAMLLQHHVDTLLTPHIPEGWEEAMEDADVPKRQRRKDRMVKMRIMKDDQYGQFFEDDDEGGDDGEDEEDDGEVEEEEREEEGGGEEDDVMPVDQDLRFADGDMEADSDYVPDSD